MAGLTAAATGGVAAPLLAASLASSALANIGSRHINRNRDYMKMQIGSKNPKSIKAINKGKNKIAKMSKKKKK